MATKKQETKKQEEKKEVGMVMPAYMQAFQQQAAADTASLVSSSVSVPRLSYRGKRWRFIVDGEETLVKELTVPVVILGVEPDAGRFVKTFYTKTYAPGDTTPPDCSSSDGISPDLWVSNPQAQRCNQCKNNVFGSAISRTGGKAKACHDSKRLWVVQPDDFEIVYGLNVPVMSLKNLSEYGKYIARNNFPLALVITTLSMEDESEFPKLCFDHTGFIAEEEVKSAMDLNQRRPWRAIKTPVLPYDGPSAALPMMTNPMGTVNGTEQVTRPDRKQGSEAIDGIIGKWEK